MRSPTEINTGNTKVPEVMKIQYPSTIQGKVFGILSDCLTEQDSYCTINQGINNITYIIPLDEQTYPLIKFKLGWIRYELLDILLDTTPTTTQEYLNLWDLLQDAESHREKTDKRINRAYVGVNRKQRCHHPLTDEEKALLIKYKYVKKKEDIKNLDQKFYEQANNWEYLSHKYRNPGFKTNKLIRQEILQCKNIYDKHKQCFTNSPLIKIENINYSDFLQFLKENGGI